MPWPDPDRGPDLRLSTIHQPARLPDNLGAPFTRKLSA